MAPQDQHSVVMGLDGIETKIPGFSGFCVVAMFPIHAALKRRWNVCRPYGTRVSFALLPSAEALG
jgi:hypothetical protein